MLAAGLSPPHHPGIQGTGKALGEVHHLPGEVEALDLAGDVEQLSGRAGGGAGLEDRPTAKYHELQYPDCCLKMKKK